MNEQFSKGKTDYLLCNILYNLSSVLEVLPSEEMRDKINQTLSLIQEKNLQVAVIGEFRRGKSSLINALLGMTVLPVDIEPTTAAINRITYGPKPKAIIYFKNGKETEVPIDKISEYVTKLTPESAETAATVKQAEIRYPTELCSNYVDIIDTPGLNDTESMTAVTESMLNEIHIAVIAIKSTMIYSDTECHWVTKLMNLPKLNCVVFVLTCMDLVRKPEVEKVVSFAKKRIYEKTMEEVYSVYKDKPELIAKAERILGEKDFLLYPVSAISALDSFDNGDYELLQESNIPTLKKGLLTVLNSQQQMSRVYATEQMVKLFSKWFYSIPRTKFTESLYEEKEKLSRAEGMVNAYFTEHRTSLVETTVRSIEEETENLLSSWLNESLEEKIREIFMKHLSNIFAKNNEVIKYALNKAENDVFANVLLPMKNNLCKAVNAIIINNLNSFLSARNEKLDYDNNIKYMEESGIKSYGELKSLVVKKLLEGIEIDFPEFLVYVPQFLLGQNIMNSYITPFISSFCKKYRKEWHNALPEYTQKWCNIVLQAEPIDLNSKFSNVIYTHKGVVGEKIAISEMKYKRAQETIDKEMKKIIQIKDSLLK